MKVSFIGAGNVATHLAKACASNGIQIKEIYSRSIENANSLADQCNAQSINKLEQLSTDIDFIILSVSDNALPEISSNLNRINVPVVHTSGSTSIVVLKSEHHSYGVLYPLQTFSKNKVVNIAEVPFFLETSSDELNSTLLKFCSMLGANANQADSNQRMNLHIAALFACNFSNHMYAIAEELMQKNKLDFELLKPLIQETALKIQSLSPKSAQTGPASRKDSTTIDKHLAALQSEKRLFELYKAISEDIAKNQNS